MAIKKSNTKAKDEGIKYEVIEKCGVISEGKNGWTTELRYIAWNDGEPKYDIRSWVTNEDGTEKCGKGITLTGEQLESLGTLITKLSAE
jgi:hypothetical protein